MMTYAQLIAVVEGLRRDNAAMQLAIDGLKNSLRQGKEANIKIFGKLQDHDQKFVVIEAAFNVVVSAINRLAFWRNR